MRSYLIEVEKMKTFDRHLQMAFLLSAFVILPLLHLPTASAGEWSATNEAILFLENVANIDTAKYNVTLSIHDVRYPDHLNGLAQENVVYNLESSESKLEAAFSFRNKTLAHYGLFVLNGLPLYSESQPTSVLALADCILGNYQKFTEADKTEINRNITGMRNVLSTIGKIENTESSLNNDKVKVTSNQDLIAFEWMYSIDGVDFPSVTMEFQKGIFCGLGDVWSIYKIGSTDVNISENGAVEIALKYVEDFSWKAYAENGDTVEVTDFNIVSDPLIVELQTTRGKEPLTMYPCWNVVLYLDKAYPGLVNRISLAIWADSGEVISCLPLSIGGELLSEDENVLLDAEKTAEFPL